MDFKKKLFEVAKAAGYKFDVLSEPDQEFLSKVVTGMQKGELLEAEQRLTEEIDALRTKNAALLKCINDVNSEVYANTIHVGSDRYFIIRGKLSDAARYSA